jgi:hypothetical protein
MSRILVLLLLVSFAEMSLAQSYGTTLGIRLGNNANYRSLGLTMNQRIVKHVTLEGIVQSDFKYNTTGHLMIRRHQSLLSRRLNAYVGTGFSFGVEESEFKDDQNVLIRPVDNKTMGVDLVAGLEFTLLKATISLDYKPNINLVGREPWYAGQVGISARTVIISGAQQNKNRRKRLREKKRDDRQDERDEKDNPIFRDWFERTFQKDIDDDDY